MTEQEKIAKGKERLVARYAGRKSKKHPTGGSTEQDNAEWNKLAAKERKLSGAKEPAKPTGLKMTKPSVAKPTNSIRSRAAAMKTAFASRVRSRFR